MPARYRDLIRLAVAAGCELDKDGGKGSHQKVRRPDGRVYTIPGNSGDHTMLDDCYVDGLFRFLGLDPSRKSELERVTKEVKRARRQDSASPPDEE